MGISLEGLRARQSATTNTNLSRQWRRQYDQETRAGNLESLAAMSPEEFDLAVFLQTGTYTCLKMFIKECSNAKMLQAIADQCADRHEAVGARKALKVAELALKRKEALRSPAPEPKAKAAPAPAPEPTSSAPQVREAVTDIAELRAALNDIRAMVAEGLMTKTDAKKASKVIAAKLASA